MNPNLFRSLWNAEENGSLMNFDQQVINILKIDEHNKEFFRIAGLPETPAPYLEFISSEGLLLNLSIKLSLSEQYKDYWYLGTTAAGEIVTLKERTGHIVAMDVQNNNKETYINSSIIHFAEFLYEFSEMILKAIEINGDDAFIDNNIPEELLMDTIKNLKTIDEAALEYATFWCNEFEDFA